MYLVSVLNYKKYLVFFQIQPYNRQDIDRNRYENLENCDDPALLTSTLKLFLREMKDPLIDNRVRDQLYRLMVSSKEVFNGRKVAHLIKHFLGILDPLAFPVLRYLLFHLRKVADVKGKKRK